VIKNINSKEEVIYTKICPLEFIKKINYEGRLFFMKKYSKLIVITILALSMVLGLTFVGAAAETKQVTIGIIEINLTNPFFVDMMKGGNIAEKEDGNLEVIWKSAEGSVEKEISLIENFVEQKVDAILIDPLDVDAVKPAMEKAFKAGIPLVTMGNFVDTPYGNVSTLYNDRVDYRNLTRILCYYLNSKGNIVHIFGKKGNFVSDERLVGFEEAVKEFPDIKVLAVQPGEWDPALAQRIMEDYLTAYPKIDGLAVWHDGIMYGAMTAIRSAGLVDEIKIVSYDGDIESSKMVKSGELVANLLTGAKRIGAWNVKVGAALARGAKLDQKVFLPTKFVILEDTLNKVRANGFKEDIQWITPDEAIDIAGKAVVDWTWQN